MTPSKLKTLFAAYQDATATFDFDQVSSIASRCFDDQLVVNHCHPFSHITGREQYLSDVLGPLSTALPDLERRDMIVIAGTSPEGLDWIGTMGNYMGTFLAPLLGIPPTGHLAHMRYHEFFQFKDEKIVEVQAIWDLPELMMQARAWPMAPQLGAFLCTPAPMSGDGLNISGDGTNTQTHVINMLTDLCRYPQNPDPACMQLEKYWHPRFNWYGPAGIGTGRGIAGFRQWHQVPFLRGMPDRKLDEKAELMSHWIAQGDYVCETGWPNMRLTLSGDGWMGIAPVNKEVVLRSLDFWRMEKNVIRENWVLVDLLDLYRQIGVDVLARMNEFNYARNLGTLSQPDTMTKLS